MERLGRFDADARLKLKITFASEDMAEDVREFVTLVSAVGIVPDGWIMSTGRGGRPATVKAVLARMQKQRERTDDGVAIAAVELGDDWLEYCHFPGYGMYLGTIFSTIDRQEKVRRARVCCDVLRKTLSKQTNAAGTLTTGRMFGRWLPDVKHAPYNAVAHVTTREQVEAAFDDPSAFWNAGWDSVEHIGDHVLVTRGLDDFDTVDWVERAAPHYWAMARAAKPGQVKFYPADRPEPEEEAIFTAGRRTLDVVGYLPEEKAVEFSCFLEPDEHIPGWEILGLARLIFDKRLKDGREAEVFRVTFLDRATAEREKRPLLEVGAEVWCYGPDGERERVT